MEKSIKPKVNEKGEPIVKHIEKGEWYWANTTDKFKEWLSDYASCDMVPVYYLEPWKPEEGELYYFCIYNTSSVGISSTKYFPNTYDGDKFRILTGNCYKTHEEAQNPDNVIKILNNSIEFYKNKLKDSPNG